MMLKFIFTIIFSCAAALNAHAQIPAEDSTGQFEYSLKILKETIDRVTADNFRLSTKNDQLKQLLAAERIKLGGLQQRQEELVKAAAKLRGTHPAHAKQISALGQEAFELQNRLDKHEAQLTVIQSAMAQKQEEDAKLSAQISELLKPQAPAPAVVDPKKDEARKEKLKLMKMIYESKDHQARLQASLVSTGKSTANAAYIQAQARKRLLKEEISNIQAQAPKEMPKAPEKSLDLKTISEIQELESHIASLQKNHDELEDLVGKMQKKAQSFAIQADGKIEHDRLMRGIDELNRENYALKSQLEGLRIQMVELDKRKTKLETMLP